MMAELRLVSWGKVTMYINFQVKREEKTSPLEKSFLLFLSSSWMRDWGRRKEGKVVVGTKPGTWTQPPFPGQDHLSSEEAIFGALGLHPSFISAWIPSSFSISPLALLGHLLSSLQPSTLYPLSCNVFCLPISLSASRRQGSSLFNFLLKLSVLSSRIDFNKWGNGMNSCMNQWWRWQKYKVF